jgi:hypothetical protein
VRTAAIIDAIGLEWGAHPSPGVVPGVHAGHNAGWRQASNETTAVITQNMVVMSPSSPSGVEAGRSHPGTGMLPRNSRVANPGIRDSSGPNATSCILSLAKCRTTLTAF